MSRRNGGWDVFYAEESRPDLLDIDKTWHMIHYTLAGTEWETFDDEPLTLLILGGKPVNDEDMGYGPARLLPADTVRQIDRALEDIDEAAFRARFHVKDMIRDHVYPVRDEDAQDEAALFDYVWQYFVQLRAFYRSAAERGRCVFAFIE